MCNNSLFPAQSPININWNASVPVRTSALVLDTTNNSPAITPKLVNAGDTIESLTYTLNASLSGGPFPLGKFYALDNIDFKWGAPGGDDDDDDEDDDYEFDYSNLLLPRHSSSFLTY